jgi:hypothetical protein
MPLAKVTDMWLHQTRVGRVFGYAEFSVESGGQKQPLSHVRFLPYPTQTYQEILGLIIPKKGPGSGPCRYPEFRSLIGKILARFPRMTTSG